ncbi:hypothetical protein CAEBREN_10593 [Caenorhabditis brenneri]|uniref:Hexosyltransferase n=1 Tax=Caenorhabditis brenneri TaxID=135651 RepID=G0NQC2_CAEBE|nr:hypothetical protein CAEBREN_10593 [Caenorhabditis brenneri]
MCFSEKLSREDRECIRREWREMGLGGIIDTKTRKIIMEEAELYDDMVVTDLEDTYEGLVFKSLSLLLYAVSKVPSARIIGKIDEDVMFFPDLFTSLIDQGVIEADGNNIYGYKVEAGAPASKDYGAIKASKTSYGCPKYPEFLAGPIYLMTRTAAQGVVKATRHRNFLVSEDTLITGILADDIGAKRVQLPYLHMFPDTPRDKKERLLAWHTKLENDHYLRFFEQWKGNL